MRFGKTPIGKAPLPPAGKFSGSAPSFYVMKVVYVDQEGNELKEPPACFYVMEAGDPPVVKKVFANPDEAEAYAQACRDQYGR
jgi:hypothetical protein